MSGYDYIQFLTEQFTTRLNASQQSPEPQHDNQIKQSTISNPWFGVLPFALKTMLKNKNSRKRI